MNNRTMLRGKVLLSSLNDNKIIWDNIRNSWKLIMAQAATQPLWKPKIPGDDKHHLKTEKRT